MPVSYLDAEKFEGRIMTVRMPVAYAFNDHEEIFLSSRINPHHAHMVTEGGSKEGFFTVSVQKEYFDLFPEDYETMLKGKEILVRGKIIWFQGDPHIDVTDPSQIKII